MAKAVLPTNFQDDILLENMNSKRRYNVIQNSDGTISLEDVTTYTQVGSNFGAAQVNATNTAVNESVDKAVVIDNKEDLMANTTSGKVAGALTVKDGFNKLNSKITKLSETEEGEISFLTDRIIRFSGNYMVKMAGVVYTNINVATTKAIANTHTLGTIPEGFRPRNNITTQFSGNVYIMSISTEGKITSLSEIPVSVNLRKNLSWIAQ